MRPALEDHMQRIEAAIITGEAAMGALHKLTPDQVTKRSLEAALMIGAYQLHVQREVFEPCARHPDARVRTAAAELRLECAGLRERLHVGVRGMASTPPELRQFATRSRAFNAAIRRHFIKVRALIKDAEQSAAA